MNTNQKIEILMKQCDEMQNVIAMIVGNFKTELIGKKFQLNRNVNGVIVDVEYHNKDIIIKYHYEHGDTIRSMYYSHMRKYYDFID